MGATLRGPLRLAAFGVAAAVIGFVVVSSLLRPGQAKRRDSGPGPQPVSSGVPNPSAVSGTSEGGMSPSTRSPTPGPLSGQVTPSVHPLPTPPAGHGDPVAVARAWALADQTWMWSDKPDPNQAARDRATAWSTQAWALAMAQSSGAAFLTAERVAAHEADTVTVTSVVQQDPSTDTSKVELVLSTVTVHRDGAPPLPKTGYLQVTVAQQADGTWAVDNVVV